MDPPTTSYAIDGIFSTTTAVVWLLRERRELFSCFRLVPHRLLASLLLENDGVCSLLVDKTSVLLSAFGRYDR